MTAATESLSVEGNSKNNGDFGEGSKLGIAGEQERKRTRDVTGASTKVKKTKIERSLDVICSSLVQSSEADMKR